MPFLFLTGFISDAMQFKHFLWLQFEDHGFYMMNLYWKEFAPLLPCRDFVLLNFVSADSRITIGRNQKSVSLLLISISSRLNLLCFSLELNQSQRKMPISRNGYVPDCYIFIQISHFEDNVKTDHKTSVSVIVISAIIRNIRNTKKK